MLIPRGILGDGVSITDFLVKKDEGLVELAICLSDGTKKTVSFPINSEDIPSSSNHFSQTNKLNVTLGDDGKKTPSSSNPKTVTISIPNQEDFVLPSVEVLEFKKGDQILKVLCAFDNGDSTDFEENKKVNFDGKMRLKTTTEEKMIDRGLTIGDKTIWENKLTPSSHRLVSIEIE